MLIEGFGETEEAVAERRPAPSGPWKVGAIVVVALAVVGVVVSLVLDRDPSAEEAAPVTTVAPSNTTAVPPRTTLAAPRASDALALPGVRPSAQLVGLAEGDLYLLDLDTGQGVFVEPEVEVEELFELDGVLVARSGRDLVRLSDSDGAIVPLADGVGELVRGHSPASIVSVTRDGSGVVARILGVDGVFRAGARLPGEAVVHGSISDRIIVSLAGLVFATDGTNSEGGFTELGAGRVVALGPGAVARLVCSVDACLLVTTDLDGTVLHETPLPELLVAVAADRWSELGSLSPDASRVLVTLQHGNGSVRGAVVVDLTDGTGVHSPELGTDFGTPAWAPDGRFVVYPFDGDLMIWDVEAAEGQLPSARASLGLALIDAQLR